MDYKDRLTMLLDFLHPPFDDDNLDNLRKLVTKKLSEEKAVQVTHHYKQDCSFKTYSVPTKQTKHVLDRVEEEDQVPYMKTIIYRLE